MRWRWPLGLVASVFTLLSTVMMVIFWAISDFDTPFDDYALDSEAARAEARVMEVRPTDFTSFQGPIYAVRYDFERADGSHQFGICYSSDARFKLSHTYDLEYLPYDPGISRLVGTTHCITTWWLPFMLPIWAGALFLFLWWFRGVLRLRVLLRDGQTTVATIQKTRPTVLVNPPQMLVRYTFTDRHGLEQTGGHWLGANSPLAKGLLAGQRTATVIYDDALPRNNRLASPEQFG